MEGVQAALTPCDVLECEAALKRNARFGAVMAQRYGIVDVDSQLAVDPWRVCCRLRVLLASPLCGCGTCRRTPASVLLL